MSDGSILQIVVLVGWLMLVITGFRSWRVSGRKTLAMIAVWAGIFAAAALFFDVIG